MGLDISKFYNEALNNYLTSIKIWNYKDPAVIEYIKKNYQDLIENKTESELGYLYHKCNQTYKGRRGRFQKFRFFIYWLSLKMKNPKWETIDGILEDIWAEYPDLIPARDPDGFSFKYSKKIRTRYKKKGIIERNMLDIKTSKSMEHKFERHPEMRRDIEEKIKQASQFYLEMKKAKREMKLKKKIIAYMKENKKAKIREISREYSKNTSDLFPILFDLIYAGMVNYDEKEKRFIFITDHPKTY